MLSARQSGRSLDEQSQDNIVLDAQLRGFSRLTPINAFVNISVSLVTGSILWPVVPHVWVLSWTGLHILLSLTVYMRWRRHRGRPSPRTASTRVLRQAKLWAFMVGVAWGCGAAFLPLLSSTHQLAFIVIIVSLSAGVSATLGAVPQAAALFILSCLLPVTLYFVLQTEFIYFGIALLALVMIGALLASSRVVYGALLEELRAKQANDALIEQFRAERQEWLDLSETTEAFALFDADDKLLLWNENYRRTFALDPESLSRHIARADVLSLCAPAIAVGQDPAAHAHWVEAQLQLHEHPEVPLVQRLTNGRWLQSRSHTTAQGNLFTIHQDITERKEAEEERERLTAQLHQSQKMEALGTLAGGIAHEFNNILAIILGFADLAHRDVSPQSRVSRYIREIRLAGQRARELVQQILAFSRRRDVQYTPERLHLLVQDILRLLQASFPATMTIQHNANDDVGVVWVNAAQIHQMVMHLCTNAEHAMRHTGGMLTVTLDTVDVDTLFQADAPHLLPGSYARLTISDTGHGIAPEVIDHIFEPFFTTKDTGEGTGMGLAIVHRIVTNHGGDMTVDSAPGVGTTFRVYLPRSSDLDSHTTARPSTASSSERGRILFVDDETALVQVASDMLTHLGYEVRAVNSSLEALALFQAAPHDFDLVITDMTMPGLTGEELTHEVRRLRPDIPVILCTGFSHVMDATKAQGIGIDAFLLKPITIKDLDLAIRRVYHPRNI
jgi:signal transduction histidine kinase/ActR/RegA family two-component response regulator